MPDWYRDHHVCPEVAGERESWIDRLLWAGLIAVFGWAGIGWAVAIGLAISGQDTAGNWVLMSWAADMILIIFLMGSVDE